MCFVFMLVCACVSSIDSFALHSTHNLCLHHDWRSDALKQATAALIGLTHSSKSVA